MSESSKPNKVKVVGIYGVSGAGMSHLLRALETALGTQQCGYFEALSEILCAADIVPPADSGLPVTSDLDLFKMLGDEAKARFRERAKTAIRNKCAVNGQVGVVAGHRILWALDLDTQVPDNTRRSQEVFTHIIYLKIDEFTLAKRRGMSPTSAQQRMWTTVQQEQVSALRIFCYRYGILFIVLNEQEANADYVANLLRNFKDHTEEANLARVKERLDHIMGGRLTPAKSILLLDAHGTLTRTNTNHLFWERRTDNSESVDSGGSRPYKDITVNLTWNNPYAVAGQVALLYHGHYTPEALDIACDKLAGEIQMFPEMQALLRRALHEPDSGAIVVTCGLQILWEKILANHGLPSIRVIGTGRLDGLIINDTVKAALVDRLRSESYNIRVTAFGDDRDDMPMLCRADRAIIVVGDEESKAMLVDGALKGAMSSGKLKPEQAVISPASSARLNAKKIPEVSLSDPTFLNALFGDRTPPIKLRIIDGTDKTAAKLLNGAVRCAKAKGEDSQLSESRIGWYLATELLSDVLGLEEYTVPHYQENHITNYRIKDEDQVRIVPLTDSSQTLAHGVCEALPLASCTTLNFNLLEDTGNIWKCSSAVILVGSMIYSNTSLSEVIKHVHAINPVAQIVVMADMTHSGVVKELIDLCEILRHPHMYLITLCTSNDEADWRKEWVAGDHEMLT